MAKSSPWSTRLKNTANSLQLLFQMVRAQFDSAPAAQRKKLPKQQLEEKTEVAALAGPLVFI